MALTANQDVDHFIDQNLRQFRVAAAVHIFKGGLCGFTATGEIKPLAAGDTFAGLAFEESDNTAGAAGDTKDRAYTLGDFELALSGATANNNGLAVYASDDATLTYTATANTLVGTQVSVPAAGMILLRLKAFI